MKGRNHTESKADHIPNHLDPYQSSAKPPLKGVIVVILIVAAISALATAGIFQSLDRKIMRETPDGQEGIELIGVSQQLAVIVVNADGRREIKLLDTQSLIVQDVTRGWARALTAALSPDGQRLALVSDSPDDPIVSVYNVHGGKPVTLLASTLLKAGEDAGFSHFAVCEWSSVSWSSDSSRFLIFGCQKDKSVVVVVSTSTPLEAVVLTNTYEVQESPRQAIWLNDHEILFSQMNNATDKSSLSKILADDVNALPILVYGE